MSKTKIIDINRSDFEDYESYKKQYDIEYNKYRVKNKLRKPRKIYPQDKDAKRKYRKTEKGLISKFKTLNIKLLENTVKDYMNATNCEFCNVKFTIDENNRKMKFKKCLDHDHLSGYARNIICHSCNMTRSKIDRIRFILMLEIHRNFKIKSIK